MTDRPAVPTWNRAVIKVGSALVAPDDRGCSTKHLLAIARLIAESRHVGKEVILVSSGAVAAGLATQPDTSAPRTIPEKQALAAIGQPLLMAHWRRLFDAPCAQLLLTSFALGDVLKGEQNELLVIDLARVEPHDAQPDIL